MAASASRWARPIRRNRSASIFAEAAAETTNAGLGQGIGGAGGERAHRGLGAVLGQGRDDEYPSAPADAKNLRKRLEAACPGHFDVEQDHVGTYHLQRRQSLAGAGGRCDDLEILVAGDHPRQHRPSDRGIVDDHHANRRLGGLGGSPAHDGGERRHATPTICSLEWRVSRSKGFMTYSSAPAAIAARI